MLVADGLSRSADRFPDASSIICGERRVSFAELDELSAQFASMLVDRGISNGDRVAILLENGIEAAVAIYGVLKARAIFVVIGQTIKADKLRFILDDCGARALVIQPVFSSLADSVVPDVESLGLVVSYGADTSQDDEPAEVVYFIPDQWSARPLVDPKPPIDLDVSALIYTSGSTGFPKGVTVSHRNVTSAILSITGYLENTPDDVILNVLPLSFDYGLYQLLMSVHVGAALVLEKSFAYPFKTIQRVHEEKVTGFPGVPTIFAMLLQMKGIEPDLLDSVRYVSNTAAALPPTHIRELKSIFRNAQIYSMYGLTECKRVSYLPPEELDRRPTSVGRAMPNVLVEILDDEGRPVPTGDVGELVVQGSNVMLGYWNRPDETAEMIRPGRFPWERRLHTGDLFKMDEDGFLYFVDRKDEIIKSRGEKVSPTEVERVIQEIEGVREVVVVGVPDPILGQALKAIVVPVNGTDLTEPQIKFHCGRRLESFMVPKEVELRDSLPKTSSGKLSRELVRQEGNQPREDDRQS